jgi:RNA polymerase sigma-70 factor (ECF subfamily)
MMMELEAETTVRPPAPAITRSSASSDPDAEVVAAAQRDPAQFRVLYRRYFPSVHGYVRLRLRDRSLCEDVTSQVFLTALAHLHDFRGQGRFAAWLFRIAQHTVQRCYRTRHQHESPIEDEPGDRREGLSDAAPGPEEQALALERRADLRALLATLDPAQQHLLALRFGAGLSTAQIGRVLGKSGVAVRVSLHRTLAQLRRRYPDDRQCP